MIFKLTKEKVAKTFAFGVLSVTIAAIEMQPIQAYAASPTVVLEQENDTTQKDKKYLFLNAPKLETEKKTYFKDGKLHDALTDSSVKDMNLFLCNMEINGEKCSPDTTPEILEAQQQHESDFIVDATNGNDISSGSCVGISQSSCRYNIDNVNEYVFLVGEEPAENKEDARELLLRYPLLNAAVEAKQLQDYYESCPKSRSGNPMKYALSCYRWGPGDYTKEYPSGSYSDGILEDSKLLKEEYDEYRIVLEARTSTQALQKLLEARFGEKAADAYLNNTASIPSDYRRVISEFVDQNNIKTTTGQNGEVKVDNEKEMGEY